ncbi:MAG: TrkA family potassium uptake protein [Firmicutes bacterium]|nr:TrkA family potassium uptake protein [Bacillota bacterium]
MKSILIIGLGRFGRHMARKFTEQGHSVLAIEKNSDTADNCIDIVKDIQIGDARSELFIDSLGINNFDLCVVAIGDDFLSSLEITVLLKDYGAKYIIARATRDVYRNLLLRNGADYVVYAERELAERLAVRFGSRNIYDYMRLGPDFEIFEVATPPSWIGHSILEKQVRRRHNITILAAKNIRTGQISASLPPDYIFTEEDCLIVLGSTGDVEKLR